MITAEQVLDLARSQIGTKEEPLGSNNVKYNEWYYGYKVSGSNYPWCAVFISWLFHSLQAQDLVHGVRSYYSGDFLIAGRKYNEEVDARKGQPGDLIIFDFIPGGITDHIGIVEKVLVPGRYQTIEGNADNMVTRKIRDINECQFWLIRPKYAKTEEIGKEEKEMAILTTPAPTTRYEVTLSPIDGDDVYIKVYSGDYNKKDTFVHVGCVATNLSAEDTIKPGQWFIVNAKKQLGFRKGAFDDSPIVVTATRPVTVTVKQ